VAFPNVTDAQQKAAKVLNEIEAIGIGIQAEKDSILFYTEFQNSLRERDHNVPKDISSS
jgi:rubrerythrin